MEVMGSNWTVASLLWLWMKPKRGGVRQNLPALAAEEAVVGEDAAPGLADEGGVDKLRRLVSRGTEEDLFDELLRQRRRHMSLV